MPLPKYIVFSEINNLWSTCFGQWWWWWCYPSMNKKLLILWGNLYQEIKHKFLGDHFLSISYCKHFTCHEPSIAFRGKQLWDEDMREPERENSRVDKIGRGWGLPGWRVQGRMERNEARRADCAPGSHACLVKIVDIIQRITGGPLKGLI